MFIDIAFSFWDYPTANFRYFPRLDLVLNICPFPIKFPKMMYIIPNLLLYILVNFSWKAEQI